MIKTLLILPFVVLFAGHTFSQTSDVSATDKQLIKRSDKTTFGASQQAVGDYLMEQDILSDTAIDFRRAVFTLQVDYLGKVTGVQPFFGMISPDLDEKIMHALMKMPLWKTTVSEGQLSLLYVVVSVRQKTISTELY